MNDKQSIQGISDIPVNQIKGDCFGLGRYIEGLSEFIQRCNTPMTIAVQGDWGCGKTSMLNMIREQLGNSVKSIWFNTWQYSKFNLDDMLSLSLLTHLYNSLDDNAGNGDNKIIKTLSKLMYAGLKVGTYILDGMGAQKLADDADNFIGNARKDNDTDIIGVIEKLKSDYQKKVNEIYDNTGKRVVVFIDDLDRLAPSKAVDLMEVLKLFLDCENCVYVLAIDYEVVTRGISEKYGKDFGEKQGKKFFDKIIQVPFFVPVEQYDINEYIKMSLDGIITPDEQYIRLIRHSVGYNPRSMKRLFNVFTLLTMINKGQNILNNPVMAKMLFAVLCFQLSMQEIYKLLVEYCDDITKDDLRKLSDGSFAQNPEGSDFLHDVADLAEESDIEFSDARVLLKELADIIMGPDEKEFETNKVMLKSILSISSTTNNTSVKPSRGVGELTSDKTVNKQINETDIKYNIMRVGADFHIGFGKSVRIIYGTDSFEAKTHSASKGRIDGLTKFYRQTGIKEGDLCQLTYLYDTKEIICEVINK